MNDAKNLAIFLTALFVKAGRDYFYNGLELYMLEAVDGTDFVVRYRGEKYTFSDAWDAAEFFAEMIWDLK